MTDDPLDRIAMIAWQSLLMIDPKVNREEMPGAIREAIRTALSDSVVARQALAIDGELHTALARIAELEAAIQYEQHRAGRIGTHGPGCHTWGPQHYECATRKLAELEALAADLAGALEAFAQKAVLEPNGIIVGLERYDFERARAALHRYQTRESGE